MIAGKDKAMVVLLRVEYIFEQGQPLGGTLYLLDVMEDSLSIQQSPVQSLFCIRYEDYAATCSSSPPSATFSADNNASSATTR
mmetsp:Transcript_19320/g.24999  ORF Transcript_19320/g.24999 Transcript_19320/m.24999 type:complete len:83 (+) Transcript_19320:131-379(+)